MKKNCNKRTGRNDTVTAECNAVILGLASGTVSLDDAKIRYRKIDKELRAEDARIRAEGNRLRDAFNALKNEDPPLLSTGTLGLFKKEGRKPAGKSGKSKAR